MRCGTQVSRAECIGFEGTKMTLSKLHTTDRDTGVGSSGASTLQGTHERRTRWKFIG